MSATAPQLDQARTLQRVLAQANEIIIGKPEATRLALCCLLARGHLLIEDQPGVGKTTLAHTLAQVLGLDYQRIQFTSDLLPADILGVSIYDRTDGSFHFHPGPVFSQLLLADEINRATPKAQSALLEAMEERQITADGQTYALPQPFFVVATQNPASQIGTYPLPESQLDRFLMRISLGYPDAHAERALLAGEDRRGMLQQLQSELEVSQLVQLQQLVDQVYCAPALLDYVQALLQFSRESGLWQQGLSPRAGLGLIAAARAWALVDERQQVIPEDVQAVLPSVAGHRLHSVQGHSDSASLQQLIEAVPIP
jgi:MoxR-like ATPase